MEVNAAGAKKERLFWADFIRCFAAISVVFLHSTQPLLTRWGEVPDWWWQVGNIVDGSARLAVPLFLMLSGALLLHKQEEYSVFFNKRVKRIVIPLIIWDFVYIIYREFIRFEDAGLKSYLKSLLKGDVYYHLWYVYAVMGLYLMTPVLRIFLRNARRTDVWYFVMLWFIAGPVVVTIQNAFGIEIGLTVINASGYVGYFLLGYLLRDLKPDKKILGWASVALVAGLFVTIFGTYWLSKARGEFLELFYWRNSPNVVIYAVSMFIVLKYISDTTSERMPALLKEFILLVSRAGFGIYLLHVLILEFFMDGRFGFVLNAKETNPLYTLPLLGFSVFIFTLSIVTFIREIPYLRKTV